MKRLITRRLPYLLIVAGIVLASVLFLTPNSPVQATGNCLTVPDSQKDNNGADGFSLSAPAGFYIKGLAIKAGNDCFPSPAGTSYTANGTYEPDKNGNPNSCYQISGIGTTTASAAKVGQGQAQICQDISHIEIEIEELATITITKDAVPNNAQDFSFTNNFANGNPATFSLDDDGTVALPNTQDFEVLPGTYSISEGATSGWELQSAICDDGSAISSILVAPGEHVTCTFLNQKLASITLIKNTIGGDSTFDFELTGEGLPTTDSLTTVSNTASEIYPDLDPDDTFTIAEVNKPGWFLSESTCTGTNTPDAITPNNGEDVTCTFTNIKIEDLEVTKTATTSFTRTFTWTLDKSVTPETWDLFKGDTGTSEYSVEVTKDSGTDSDFSTSGTITIYNPNSIEPLTATISAVTDIVDVDQVMAVDCGVSFPYSLAPLGTLQCTYEGSLPNGTDTQNTATVTTTGLVPGAEGTADVDFTEPTTLVNDQIDVDDSNGSSWHFTDSGIENYDRTFSCPELGSTDYPNTATISGTLISADASVEVNCYDPIVSKTATTSADRTYTWTIEKTADQTDLVLAPGQTQAVNYTINVSASSADSNFAVEGEIDVENTAPIPAVINEVSDLIAEDIIPDIDCGVSFPYSLAGNSHLICSYSSPLPDADTRLNTATAIQQNYSYDSQGLATPLGTTEYTGTALINFADAVLTEIDESIDVSDTYTGNLGTINQEDAPESFLYQREITASQCGLFTVPNTASFVTNDTAATGESSWSIDVTAACTCSLTQGYWKTHSEQGPAAHPDETWQILGGPDTEFFDTGITYLTILNTPPKKGNAYYTLAHQYIATQLNLLNGAAAPTSVQDAFNTATGLFNAYGPEVDGLKGKTGTGLRNQFITLAGILGSFNEGVTNLAGHCSE